MTEEKPKVKYKPLGIKVETYTKLNEKKAKREIELGKPISFDQLISELMNNAKD
jgi:hypothetical protein